MLSKPGINVFGRIAALGREIPRRAAVGIILIVALFAFELFNFDTTRYALTDLMGDIRFLGFQWAAILAIAFCSIDFAGLVRLFTPEKGRDEPKEVWYLMGAWLLGATMNALMTWWAISLTLLNHDFGNEVLSRGQLLDIVPVFVAVLVWLTRILFIGAFTVAGERIFDFRDRSTHPSAGRTIVAAGRTTTASRAKTMREQRSEYTPTTADVPGFLGDHTPAPPVRSNQRNRRTPLRQQQDSSSRIRQRPPMPNGMRKVPHSGVQARPRTRN
jgi:hypothetical protein